MIKIHNFNDLNPCLFVNPVVTVGFFDGVHKGHIYVIRQLLKKAKEFNGEAVIITLWPHPKRVLYPEKEIKLLNSIDEKIELLKKTGIHHLIVLPFTHDFSKTSSFDFLNEILVKKIGINSLLMGFDNHIGHNRDQYETLVDYANKLGFTIGKAHIENQNKGRISSSIIREAVSQGKVDKVNQMLGYNYTLTGKVVKGKELGRTIGFPTANIELDETLKIVPSSGVYAVMAKVNNLMYLGMANIGIRPTVNNNINDRSIEINIFNFDKDIYGHTISVQFISRMRDERKFSGIEELTLQLIEDKKFALRLLTE